MDEHGEKSNEKEEKPSQEEYPGNFDLAKMEDTIRQGMSLWKALQKM